MKLLRQYCHRHSGHCHNKISTTISRMLCEHFQLAAKTITIVSGMNDRPMYFAGNFACAENVYVLPPNRARCSRPRDDGKPAHTNKHTHRHKHINTLITLSNPVREDECRSVARGRNEHSTMRKNFFFVVFLLASSKSFKKNTNATHKQCW